MIKFLKMPVQMYTRHDKHEPLMLRKCWDLHLSHVVRNRTPCSALWGLSVSLILAVTETEKVLLFVCGMARHVRPNWGSL